MISDRSLWQRLKFDSQHTICEAYIAEYCDNIHFSSLMHPLTNITWWSLNFLQYWCIFYSFLQDSERSPTTNNMKPVKIIQPNAARNWITWPVDLPSLSDHTWLVRKSTTKCFLSKTSSINSHVSCVMCAFLYEMDTYSLPFNHWPRRGRFACGGREHLTKPHMPGTL